MNTTENNNCVRLERTIGSEITTKFVNPSCLMLSSSGDSPWQLYNITTGDSLAYSEKYFPGTDTILGECSITEGKDSFLLYRYGGEIVLYSQALADNIVKISEEPDILTNSETWDRSTDLWVHSEDSIETVAFSPDMKYQVVMEAGAWNEKSVCHNAEFDYYTYWLKASASDTYLFAITFPKNRFISIAVKDTERAAILDVAGIYYEFNPQTGEIYKSGKLAIEPETGIGIAQMVVNFDSNLVSVICHGDMSVDYSDNMDTVYYGGLFSTETYESVYMYDMISLGGYIYPDGWGYMYADLQCEHIYYRDSFANEHLVLTLPDSIRK